MRDLFYCGAFSNRGGCGAIVDLDDTCFIPMSFPFNDVICQQSIDFEISAFNQEIFRPRFRERCFETVASTWGGAAPLNGFACGQAEKARSDSLITFMLGVTFFNRMTRIAGLSGDGIVWGWTTSLLLGPKILAFNLKFIVKWTCWCAQFQLDQAKRNGCDGYGPISKRSVTFYTSDVFLTFHTKMTTSVSGKFWGKKKKIELFM